MNKKSCRIMCFFLCFIMSFNFVFSSLNISFAEEESSFDKSSGNVDFIQRAITYLFVFGVADQLKALITLMFGKVSIDMLLFNHYPDTRLCFYKDSEGYGKNKFLASGVLDMISDSYIVFRRIACAIYLVLLLYVGINIVVKSTARDKDKFKAMLLDWLIGAMILFFFPVVIKYSIAINDALVKLVYVRVVEGNDSMSSALPSTEGVDIELIDLMGAQNTLSESKDMMNSFRDKAIDDGNLMYGFIYLYLVFKLLNFIVIYFKREITVIFLIVLFPFVAVTYAIDKIKDGSAQIFSGWLNEFLLNVFMQFFMGCIYVVVMFVINAFVSSGEANVVLVCIGLGYITKSDQLIRILFPKAMKGGGAGTVSPIAQTVKTAAAVNFAKKATNKIGQFGNAAVNAKGNIENRIEQFNLKNDSKVQESLRAIEEKKMRQKDVEANRRNLASGRRANVQSTINSATGATGGDGSGSGDSGEGASGEPHGTGAGLPAGSASGAPGVGGGSSSGGGGPKSNEEIASRFDAVRELAMMRQLGLSDPRIQKMYEERMSKLSPAEREKLEQDMMLITQVDEIVTGKSIDGGIVTRESINIATNIVFEAIHSSDSKYDDFKQYLSSHRINIGDKSPVSVRLDEFFGDPRLSESKGSSPYYGLAYKGKRLDFYDRSQMSSASKFLGGRDGVNCNAKIEGSYDKATGRKTVTGGRLSEGQDVGAEVVCRLTDRERKKAISRKTANGDTIADKLVERYGGSDAKKSDQEDLRKASQHLLVLMEYRDRLAKGSIDGVDASEVFQITSELSELSEKNKKVRSMVADSFGVTPTPDDLLNKPTWVSDSGDQIRISMGTTLEALRTASAITTVTDKKMSGDRRAEAIEDSVTFLQELGKRIESNDLSLDDATVAMYDSSRLDMYLEGPQDENRIFVEEGLIREDKTNEEIAEERSTAQKEAKKKIIYKKQIQQETQEAAKVHVNVFTTLVTAAGKGAKEVTSSVWHDTKEFGKRVVQGRNYIEPESVSRSYDLDLSMDEINERVLMEDHNDELRKLISPDT